MPYHSEAVALVANHLVLVGRGSHQEPVTHLELEVGGRRWAVAVRAFSRIERDVPKRANATGVALERYILACELTFEQAKQLATANTVSIAMRSESSGLNEQALAVSSLADAGMRKHDEAIRTLCAEIAPRNSSFARIVLSILANEPSNPTITCHLERHLVAPGVGFMASGWSENLGEHEVIFLLDDFRLGVNPSQIVLRQREDVARHLHGLGRHGGSPLHGFICIEDIDGEEHELRLAGLMGARVQWSAALSLSSQGSPRQLVQAVAELVPSREHLYLLSSSSVLQTLIGMAWRRRPSVEVAEYKTAPGRCDLSIIVPFYREDFFLLDHLESQSRAGPGVEWIFVCDDPGLLTPMSATCRARQSEMQRRTRMLALSENAGFATANNIAFRHAAGEFVAFMNSDVHASSFAPIEYGLDILRNDRTVGAVGFVMHFEDGTLQHAGMELQVAPELGGMLLCRHPGKGLPRPNPDPRIRAREVEAVTGAMMIVRRGDFDDGVFDEGYAGGDFEDCDLCLELRSRGRRIMLVECDGIYHLERQSIRTDETHRLLTLANCARFTRKWRPDGRRRA